MKKFCPLTHRAKGHLEFIILGFFFREHLHDFGRDIFSC